MQVAHDAGVLHRDLKPSNVLIDTSGQPHITDFGLAKRLEGASELTASEQVLGTPSYMPPEQATGQNSRVGFASDVYARGAILYELLAGRPPFRGDAAAATIRQVLESEPVAPRRLNPAVSRDLETICLKCLEKEPRRRYATAADLASELDRFMTRRPIRARAVGPLGCTWRWCRRNPALALALALLVALAVGGPAVAAYTSSLLQRAEAAEEARIATQILSLRSAAPESVPAIASELNRRRGEVVPQLAALWGDPALTASERTRLSLFLYPEGAPYVQYAQQRLLDAGPQEFGMLRQLLAPHHGPLVEALWREAGAAEPSPRALRAAAALAAYDPNDERWATHAPGVVADLVNENSLYAGFWAQHFEPVKTSLLPHLCAAARDSAPDRAAQRALATDLVATYAADDPQLLVELLTTADARQFNVLFPALAAHGEQAARWAEKRLDQSLAVQPADSEDDSAEAASANLAVALLRLGRPQRCWPLLAHRPDPTLRTRLIHCLLPLGAGASAVASRLAEEPDASIRRALILALGETQPPQIPAALREQLVAGLLELVRRDPDTGIYAAAEWVLRKWGHADELKAIGKEALDRDPASPLGRFVTCEGQVMTVVRGPIEFVMGATPDDKFGNAAKDRRVVRIDRSFAVAVKEVTREEYLRFENDPEIKAERAAQGAIWHNASWSKSFGPDPQCPHLGLPWTVAARYCRWLSEQEGLPEEEMCFPHCRSSEDPVRLPSNYLDRTGYRMPTSAEWEYTARAGAATVRYLGRSPALVSEYAWYNANIDQRSWPVGLLKPNDFGLFDVHGNVRELCLNRASHQYPAGERSAALDEEEADLVIEPLQEIELRGGSFNDHPRFLRAASRDTRHSANTGSSLSGLRLARTIRPARDVENHENDRDPP